MAVISNKGKKKVGVYAESVKGDSLKESIKEAIAQFYKPVKSSSAPVGPRLVKVTVSNTGGVSAVGYLGGKKKLSVARPVETEQEYIHLIRKGIRKGALDHLMLAANISPSEMAEIMEVKPKVFAALKPNTLLEKSQSEKAVNIARLYALGEEVFGSAAEFDKWMNGRVPSLGKKRPKEFLDTASGISLLMDEVGRIQHGVYS